ncbi:MAG: ABC transporter ATP-binding protein [Oscillospiraceae bacterium]|nr:ABC transporter ATP-binding protein [Oscillospiraceae bacterium]
MIIRAATGMCSPGEVISTVLYFSELLTGIKYVSSSISEMPVSLKFCKYIFDFLDIPDEKYKGTIPTEKRDDNEYEFEFKHVYFKYPDSENYVLKDVNLKWRIGEKMALVGKNGCGKSTLVKLLCRLYDPTEGEITLNGIDIRKYKYEEYMALFSVVFQDSKLFSFSLAENVAADTEYDAERVESCVRRAGLSERLDTMENGIETCLYKDFDDKGVEISGGEMQKLCLARAIYKGSPFIVLDEPTAALDPISEHDIYTKFNGIVGTRTAIYISHRLSSCRFCDEITVMENGRIAERGSHDELLSKGGVYTELWTAQAEYYKDTAGELYALN